MFQVEKTKFPAVQALRGIASLAVCWFHLTTSNGAFRGTFLGQSGAYGWLGVEAFFVISGFIIPYTMLVAGYRLANFRTFLVKRIVRVDPPYILSILFCIGLAYTSVLSPLYRGALPYFSATQIVLHLGYLIPFFRGFSWINPVYWTLSVEFQYYLGLAVLFPVITSKHPAYRISAVIALSILSLVLPSPTFLPHFLPLFLLGISTAIWRTGALSQAEYVVSLLIATATGLYGIGAAEMIVGVGALAFIVAVKSAPAVLLMLGDVSYSLYLVHEPVGRRFVNLLFRFTPVQIQVLLPVAGTICALAAAYLMYRAVELPAKRWAGRIKYG